MIEQIGKIISNGHAYAVEGDVYFDVRSLNEYGTLSGRKQEDNRAGERVVVDERKKDPADFALWKAKKDGEPYWESPWGQVSPSPILRGGRPQSASAAAPTTAAAITATGSLQDPAEFVAADSPIVSVGAVEVNEIRPSQKSSQFVRRLREELA